MDFDEQKRFFQVKKLELEKLFSQAGHSQKDKGNNANRYLSGEEKTKLCQILEIAQENTNQLWGLIQSSGQPFRPFGILNFVENLFNYSYDAFKYAIDMELKGVD